MTTHLTRRTRLLMALSALTLATGALATVATSVGAATAPHHVNRPAPVPLPRIPALGLLSASSFQVINYNSGLCLGIASNMNDANALQWGCNGNSDQQWHWGSQDPSAPNYRQLINGNGSCLGVGGGSLADGARIVGWDCYGPTHPDQYWWVMPVTCAGGYQPLLNLNSDLVMGVSGNQTNWGAPIVQWTYQAVCNNQFWLF